MQPLIYTCPATGRCVEARPRDDDEPPTPDHYFAIVCRDCGLIHFVMPGTGKVMGTDD